MRAWEEFLTKQEQELGNETVQKWLRPLKVTRFDACNLYLEASDAFKVAWFEEQMRHRVQTELFNNNRKLIKVHISVPSEHEENVSKKRQIAPTARSSGTPDLDLTFNEIDPEARFDTFLPCKGNQLAYKMLCESVRINAETLQPLKEDSLDFNPIYLSGHSGTGKTHLLMATANQLQLAGQKVIYVTADTFTEHVVNAIRKGNMQACRKIYRNVDALLIDDIETFSRKGTTQEELFHTFNALHIENKQIILSASCPPQELKFIEPRLISRFEWGVTLPLQVPEKEELKQILHNRAKKLDFFLEDPVEHFLLNTFGNNTKGLVRALDMLIIRTHLGQEKTSDLPLSLHEVEAYLQDLIIHEEQATLTPGKIIRSVAEYFGIQMQNILSKSQKRQYALPRQIAMHLCRKELKLPYLKIGDFFARDHSTVMASVKQIEKEIEAKNYEIVHAVAGISKLIKT